MGNPIILQGGKTSQLGPGVLRVNAVEQLSGTVLVIGSFDPTSLVGIPCTTVINVEAESNATPLTVAENSGSQYVAEFHTIDLNEGREKGIRVLNAAYSNSQLVIKSNAVEVTASSFDIRTSVQALTDESPLMRIHTGDVTGVGPSHSGNVSIYTGSSLTDTPGNAGTISLYTGVGASNGGIVIETNGGSTYTPFGREIIISSPEGVMLEAGNSGDLYFAARTKILSFNSSTDPELVGFSPTTESVVGALNELKSETSSVEESFYTPIVTPDLNVTSATAGSTLVRNKQLDGTDRYTTLTGSITVEATAAGKCAVTVTRPDTGLNNLISIVVSGHDVDNTPVTCAGVAHSSSTFMVIFDAPTLGPSYQISFTAMYRATT